MAVPRNRHSNARKNTRRAHHAKKPRQFMACANCGNSKPSHVICPNCGHYAGREVVKSYEES